MSRVKGDRPIGFDRGATLGAHDEEVVADAHMNQRLAAQRFDQLDQAIDRLRALARLQADVLGRTPKVNCSVPLIASRAAGGESFSVPPRVTEVASPFETTEQGVRFIGGEPMKPATNDDTGASKSSAWACPSAR